MAPATGVPRSSAHTMQANIGRPCRKVRGAVQRIDHPGDLFRFVVHRFGLLGDDGVLGEEPRQLGAEVFVRSMVGVGDGIAVVRGLIVDVQGLVEVAEKMAPAP